MAEVGRPTVMTDETLGKLREAFLLGCTDEEACVYADIHPSTLYDYQKQTPGYSEEKESLKQNPILLARKSVVNALSKDYEHALKFLERKKKNEFSLRTETDLTTGGKPLILPAEIINKNALADTPSGAEPNSERQT